MNDIGAHVGYTVLWDRVSKIVRARVQMYYYPAAPQFHVMTVLSGTRVVRKCGSYVLLWLPLVVRLYVCTSGLRPSVIG